MFAAKKLINLGDKTIEKRINKKPWNASIAQGVLKIGTIQFVRRRYYG